MPHLIIITTDESLYIAAIKSHIFKQFVIFPDEPGKPGRPEPRNWDKDFVELEWSPPKNDGGAPITGYIVQKREKGGRWV